MDESMKLCATAIVLATQALLSDSSEESEDSEESEHFRQDIPSSQRPQYQNLRRRRNQHLRQDVEELQEFVEPGPSSVQKGIPKLVNYIATIHAYQPDIFKSHFRMTRQRVALLEGILRQRFKEISSADGRPNIPLNYRILLSLWTLGNQESFRGIADRFGVGVGTAHDIFMEMCILINEQKKVFIKWPTDYSSLVDGFKTSRNTTFPGVIGAIDGVDISIICPRYADKKSYFNGKGSYSLKVQGICDSKKRFLNIFVGYPGSCHVAEMWQASGIYEVLSNTKSTLPPGYHLIGDSAYPLQSFLMKPYWNNGHLSPKQLYFNRILNSSRIVVENVFGLLIERFRRLKHLGMHQIKDMCIVISAACVLHNFIEEQNILEDNEDSDFDVDEQSNSSKSEIEENDDICVEQNDRYIAVLKRNQICDRLWAERH